MNLDDFRRAVAISQAGNVPLVLTREQAEWLEGEIERLRDLIKGWEWTPDVRGYHARYMSCTWCGEPYKNKKHADHCPAFTPEGEVR